MQKISILNMGTFSAAGQEQILYQWTKISLADKTLKAPVWGWCREVELESYHGQWTNLWVETPEPGWQVLPDPEKVRHIQKKVPEEMKYFKQCKFIGTRLTWKSVSGWITSAMLTGPWARVRRRAMRCLIWYYHISDVVFVLLLSLLLSFLLSLSLLLLLLSPLPLLLLQLLLLLLFIK